MKPVAAVVLCASLAACASAPRPSAEPTVHNAVGVECVASNYKRSGCTTTYAIVVTVGPDSRVPDIDDLLSDSHESRF